MVAKYFHGIEYAPSSMGAEIFTLKHNRNEWYCCVYNVRNRFKKNVVKTTNSIAVQKTTANDWQFHHVVERHNLCDLPLAAMGLGTVKDFYNRVIPTVMISKGEHLDYFTKVFAIPEFRELYLHPNASQLEDQEKREEENNTLYRTGKYSLGDVKVTLEKMKHLYQEAYTGNYIFKTISKNFFEDLQRQINAMH